MTNTILVIDDDEMLRKTLAIGLRRESFEVITAESAEMAKEILSRISVDIIILDRMMQGMDGLTFLEQYRKTNQITPVIMLTALSGADNTIDGLSGGADDYMSKPFKLQELVLRIHNLLKTRTPQQNREMPENLLFIKDEFYIVDSNTDSKKLLVLSAEEKKFLYAITNPIGNIVSVSPMIAKRLRTKINSVLSNIDIITVRGQGYKLITIK
ncbi:MAG: response regulator transcription factor [Alphaproteobacteria bacterium]|nr:response regulator transcription factor [Alphaproteobacteria bacterium]